MEAIRVGKTIRNPKGLDQSPERLAQTASFFGLIKYIFPSSSKVLSVPLLSKISDGAAHCCWKLYLLSNPESEPLAEGNLLRLLPFRRFFSLRLRFRPFKAYPRSSFSPSSFPHFPSFYFLFSISQFGK